ILANFAAAVVTASREQHEREHAEGRDPRAHQFESHRPDVPERRGDDARERTGRSCAFTSLPARARGWTQFPRWEPCPHRGNPIDHLRTSFRALVLRHPQGPVMAKNSILDLLLDHAHNRGSDTACLVKSGGTYGPVTWAKVWEDAQKVGKALIAAGIEPGDRVNIVGQTCYQWVFTDLGILAAGAVTVPIYPSNLPDECQYVSEHSGARLVFAENADQVDKFLEQRDGLGDVIKVVQWHGEKRVEDEWVVTMEEFLAAGEDVNGDQLGERGASLSPD